MNNFSIAVKNLKNNFSFYSLYLVSAAFVITVYFTFTSFSMNRVMLEKMSSDGRIESMCRVISVCLMIFVVFYMSYSNRFFLRRRTKELGIYALLGYHKSTMLSLLTFENILVCSGALAAGLVFGAILHKAIVYGITVLLNLTIDNSQIPFFNLKAIADTIRFILLVVFVMVLSNARFLLKSSLMDLVRFEKSAEKKLKFRKIPAASGFLFIVGGYGLALDIFRGARSIWMTFGFYPTGLVLKEHNGFPLSTIFSPKQILLIICSISAVTGSVILFLGGGYEELIIAVNILFASIYICNIVLAQNLKNGTSSITKESGYHAALQQLQKEEILKSDFADFLHDDVLQDLLAIKNMMSKAHRTATQDMIVETQDGLNMRIRRKMQDYHPALPL